MFSAFFLPKTFLVPTFKETRWALQEHCRLTRKNSRFLVPLLRFCFGRITRAVNFQRFFTSKRPCCGYIQWNACCYLQTVCRWTRCNNVKLIINTLKFLVALLRFSIRTKALWMLNFLNFLSLIESLWLLFLKRVH